MNSKYGYEFPVEVINKNIDRLTNQTWKIIPMFENEEDWHKQLYTVKLEIAGLNEIFINCPQFLQLLSKLEGIYTEEELEFTKLRTAVFESISLLQGLKK